MSEKLLAVLQNEKVDLSFRYAGIFISKPVTGTKIIQIDDEPVGVMLYFDKNNYEYYEIYFSDLIFFKEVQYEFEGKVRKWYQLYLEGQRDIEVAKFSLHPRE